MLVQGENIIVEFDGVECIADSFDFEFNLEKDERKPTNKRVPVTHYTGLRCKIGVKGALEGWVPPRAGASVAVAVSGRGSFDTTTLPPDVQDVIAGNIYSDWCAGDMKTSVKQENAEFDFEVMSDCQPLPATV